MTLSIHVVAHKTTDVVLAAYTYDGEPDDALASAVGAALPVVYPGLPGVAPRPLGDVPVAELSDDTAPGSTVLALGSVLDSPLLYTVTRDAQGAIQSVQAGTTLSNAVADQKFSGSTLSITLPSSIELTVGRPGWVRLIDPTTLATYDAAVTFMPISPTDLTHATATVIAPANSNYTMLLLVKGFAAAVVVGVAVS